MQAAAVPKNTPMNDRLITVILIACIAEIPCEEWESSQGVHHEGRKGEEDSGDRPAAECREQFQCKK